MTTNHTPKDAADAPFPTICVLMPLHNATDASHLAQALTSIRVQTLPPDKLLVVADGALSPEHERVLCHEGRISGSRLEVLRPGKVGLVGALNAGLAASSSTWIARMDADDVSDPDRLRQQIDAATQRNLDVLGSAMWEFESDPDRTVALRLAPTSHEGIVRSLRVVNSMNHPSVLMRRSAVLDAGGYVEIPGMEDYHLWVRLAARGARFCNLPEPLVRFRVTKQLYRRRASPTAVKAEWAMQRHLRTSGLIGPGRMVVNLVARVTFRLLPPWLMKIGYSILRRFLGRASIASS